MKIMTHKNTLLVLFTVSACQLDAADLKMSSRKSFFTAALSGSAIGTAFFTAARWCNAPFAQTVSSAANFVLGGAMAGSLYGAWRYDKQVRAKLSSNESQSVVFRARIAYLEEELRLSEQDHLKMLEIIYRQDELLQKVAPNKRLLTRIKNSEAVGFVPATQILNHPQFWQSKVGNRTYTAFSQSNSEKMMEFREE